MALFSSRKDDQKVKELFDVLERINDEFESIERPKLEIETPTQKSETPSGNGRHQSSFLTSKHNTESLEDKQDEASIEKVNASGIESQLGKAEPKFGKVGGDDLAEEIGDWEFDVHVEDLKTSS
jgi:hypothetical protein